MILAEITKDTFDDQVLKAGQPVMVDFYSPTCGFCKKLAPVLEQLADELHDQLQIVKLDATRLANLPQQVGLLKTAFVVDFWHPLHVKANPAVQ